MKLNRKKLNQFVNIVKNLRLFTEKETGNILSGVEMAFKNTKTTLVYKVSYRPINILSNLSKAYERLLYK